MSSNTSDRRRIAKWLAIITVTIASLTTAIAHDHDADADKDRPAAPGSKEVTGEVVDMMCYVDHNAMGEKHGSCGSTCIKSGGPVGIVSDGKAYLVVGEHKPMNDQLAQYCGKTITLRAKVAERGGVAMLENAEIVKK
jgi:hypothetical protein